MLIDGRRVAPDAVFDCTVCIVGSGAAGITVALELIRRGHDVVLLEAGGVRSSGTYQATCQGEVSSSRLDEHSTHPPLDSVRVKKLGGTTGVWGGRCVPLDPIDFERRDHVSDSGWPITHDSLVTHYRRANAYCEAGRPEYRASEALPHSERFLLMENGAADITDSKILRFSRPTDFGKAYRERLHRSRVLRCIHHANVLRLERERAGERVDRVVVASSPGREFRVRARHFVIAAGGLETARLLLASARFAGTPMGAGDELVGRFYMTHLDGAVGEMRFYGRAPKPAHAYEVSRDGIYVRRLICLTPEAQRANRVLNLGAVLHVTSPDDPSHGDGLLSSFALAKDLMYRGKLGFKSRRHGLRRPVPLDYREHLLNIARNPWRTPRFAADWLTHRWLASRKVPSFLVESRSGAYRFVFNAEQSPSHANRVELGDEWDAFGVPRVRVRWSVKEEDHRSILDSLDVIARNLRSLDVGSVEVPKTVDQLLEETGGGFLAGTHAMGTTRMSASPRHGVVDGDCRVHGIRNLYVASSSVFPTSGYAAPTLTIVALATRIADRIQAQL